MSDPKYRLLEIRQSLRLYQHDLAKMLGVCKATIVNWERKGPVFTVDHLRIFDEIGINVSYFWGLGDIVKPGVRLIDVIAKVHEILKTEEAA